jgi:glycosyltransferase involved in cell wall biosynthesis
LLKKTAIIIVSHKRVLQEKGGIESMIGLLIHKFSSWNIPVSLVYRELFTIVGVLKENKQKNKVSAQGSEIKYRKTVSTATNMKVMYALELIFLLHNLLFSLIATLKILALIKDYRRKGYWVIIHAMDTIYGGMAAFFASKLTDAPFVTHTHGVRAYFMHVTSKSNVVKAIDFLIEKITVKNCCLLISVNQEAAEFWNAYGIPKDKIRIIPVPVETKLIAPSENTRVLVRSELGIDTDSIVYGYVGRLSPEKNLLTLIEAFYRANVNAKLIIVGDGPLMSTLKRYVYSKEINSKVVFTGFRNDIHNIINAVDILILPSLIEGLPTVILEAYSNGKPVIASDITPNREVVQNGSEGILFHPYSVDQLKNAIVELYENSPLRVKLAANARKKAKLYDADTVLSKLLDVYEEVRKQV